SVFSTAHSTYLSNPISKLLPYTTLFRSVGGVPLAEVTGVLLSGGQSRRMGAPKALLPVEGEPLIQRAARALSPFPHRLLVLDRPERKSTRLNSSHVKISYAVFCLKKKNR